MRRQLKSKSYILLEKEIIERIDSDYYEEAFCLTESIKRDFLTEIDYKFSVEENKELKRFDSIPIKNLFYPDKTKQSINELLSLLQPDFFNDVQNRLLENNMRTGFACLFSGGPGTGKTETAYQMARITGRDIMQVNIADTKSFLFGQSEKQIKDVFDRYRTYTKKCKATPILLFNEADAVLGKRRSVGKDSLAQTENAIQNIILQELENLNGILIATTNLTENMDSAFERRFLYKIEFEKPGTEARNAIWLSLIQGISPFDASELASRFDFSGGQIENIARKVTVHRVLSGKCPELNEMVRFCEEERIGKEKVRKIGFTA